MYKIEYDSAKNRLYVKAGIMSMQEVLQYCKDFEEILKEVKPGFTGLTDLSEAKLLSHEAESALAALGELCVKKGLKKWVYYTESALSKMQMKRMYGDIVVAFNKLEEAEDYLNG